MKKWPELTEAGDLPAGIHTATLDEVIARFGVGSTQRMVVARRLQRIYLLVRETRCLSRFVVFGSFVSAKAEPNDVDIFLLMEDSFNVNNVSAEARIVFDHLPAQNRLGASVFWLRRLAALDGEQATIEHWQIKRDRSKRGIVEVIDA